MESKRFETKSIQIKTWSERLWWQRIYVIQMKKRKEKLINSSWMIQNTNYWEKTELKSNNMKMKIKRIPFDNLFKQFKRFRRKTQRSVELQFRFYYQFMPQQAQNTWDEIKKGTTWYNAWKVILVIDNGERWLCAYS